MSLLDNPFRVRDISTRVKLSAYQMNNDLMLNLKLNLKRQEEKKCNIDGYVSKVYKILPFDDENGFIEPENFMADAIYNIKYVGKIWMPMPDTQIICKVGMITRQLISMEYGPILCIARVLQEYNNKNFKLDSNSNLVHIASNKIIEINDYLKVTITNTKFATNDVRIMAMVKVDDFATKLEIEKYFIEDIDEEMQNEEEKIKEEIIDEKQENQPIEDGTDDIQQEGGLFI